MKFIRLIDQFGVTFTPNISKDDSEFKTAFGGFMTFIIYTLSTAYSIYILYQWANGDLPPTTNFSTEDITNFTYFEDKEFLSIGILDAGNQDLNPFSETKRYLSPYILDMPFQKPDTRNVIKDYGLSTRMTLQNFNFSNNYNTEDRQFYFIGLARCQNTTNSQICASNSEIDEFLTQPLLKISVQFYLSQFDKKSKQISNNTIRKEFINFLDINKTIYQQSNLKLSKTQVQDGVLFQSETDYYFIENIELQTSTLNVDIMKAITQQNLYYGVLMVLDTQVQVTSIVYPVAGEVIAQIGSIVSLIMFLQNLVTFINSFKLQRFLEDSIIQFYYPEFQKLKIEKNIKGEIKRVQKINVDYDPYPVNEIYQKLRILSRQKLSILNICYEISRIQFVLQSIYPRETLEIVKNVGIKLPLTKVEHPHLKKKNQLKIQQNSFEQSIKVLNVQQIQEPAILDPLTLNDKDFSLFMQDELQAEKYEPSQDDSGKIPEFIQKNYIDSEPT